MTLRRARLSCALLSLLLVLSFVGPSEAFLQEYRDEFNKQLAFIASKHPPYVWGGISLKGVDCSGYLFLAAKWAGVPGVVRTTANRMSQGLAGWDSRNITMSEATAGDLIFWTFTESRVNGHTGAFAEPKKGEKQAVYHASGSRGVVRETAKGWIIEKMSRTRRLTIGD